MSDQELQEQLRREELAQERGESVEKVSPPVAEAEEDVGPEFESDLPEADMDHLSVDTAFVVFAQDGVGYASVEISNIELDLHGNPVRLTLSRKAGQDDLYRYATEVAKDVQVQETAHATAHALAEQQARVQRVLQDEFLQHRLDQRGTSLRLDDEEQ